MALNWQAPSGGNFDDIFYAFLKVMEGNTLAPVPVNGNPTIGVGFDLVAGGKPVQDAVLEGLGLTPDIVRANQTQIDAFTPGSWQAIEYGYIQQLRALMVPGGSAGAMDLVMQDRAMNPDPQFAIYVSARQYSFAFFNDTGVRAVYTALLPIYTKKVYDRYPALENDAGYATSREKMVLTDLAWNGGDEILGSGLGDAIASGNRAEAWFEIRYRSNGGDSRSAGLAKRRYQVSELFGLYDNPAGASGIDEATSVYNMFTKNRDVIFAYEALFGV